MEDSDSDDSDHIDANMNIVGNDDTIVLMQLMMMTL